MTQFKKKICIKIVIYNIIHKLYFFIIYLTVCNLYLDGVVICRNRNRNRNTHRSQKCYLIIDISYELL